MKTTLDHAMRLWDDCVEIFLMFARGTLILAAAGLGIACVLAPFVVAGWWLFLRFGA